MSDIDASSRRTRPGRAALAVIGLTVLAFVLRALVVGHSAVYDGGPPAEEPGFSFRRPHDYFTSSRPLDPAFARRRRGGRLFIVIVKEAEAYLQLFGLRQRGFDLVSKQVYPGSQRVMSSPTCREAVESPAGEEGPPYFGHSPRQFVAPH